MAETRRGLGRGLSALLGEADEARAGDEGAGGEGSRDIPLELIHRNGGQPRTHFGEEELAELETSIRASGVLQPILVRPSGNQPGMFEVIAGERRWRAAQRVGLKTIPALVRQVTDFESFRLAIVENVQRADLNAMEEARAYSLYMGTLGCSQEAASQALGKSRSHIANTLRLIQLPEAVQVHVLEGRLTAGHARAILASDDQEKLAELIIARGLSVRDAEALVRARAAGPKKASGPRKAPKDADTQALESDLEDALGMSVDVADRGGAGELRIRYESLEQLDELCRRLTRS